MPPECGLFPVLIMRSTCVVLTHAEGQLLLVEMAPFIVAGQSQEMKGHAHKVQICSL